MIDEEKKKFEKIAIEPKNYIKIFKKKLKFFLRKFITTLKSFNFHQRTMSQLK
jgi:hypothetical protein